MGLEPFAAFVDIFYRMSQVAEISAASERLRVPVVGQLHLSLFVPGGGKK